MEETVSLARDWAWRPSLSGGARDKYPIDPLAVHVDHFQPQAIPLDGVANRGNVAELVQD